MKAVELMEVLREQYGINTIEEFNDAAKKNKGVDIGMFTRPFAQNGERSKTHKLEQKDESLQQ